MHIYPEGKLINYYAGVRDDEFHRGAFKIACEAQVPILPIVISWRKRRGLYRIFMPKRPCVSVEILEPIKPNYLLLKRAQVSDLENRAIHAMKKGYQEANDGDSVDYYEMNNLVPEEYKTKKQIAEERLVAAETRATRAEECAERAEQRAIEAEERATRAEMLIAKLTKEVEGDDAIEEMPETTAEEPINAEVVEATVPETTIEEVTEVPTTIETANEEIAEEVASEAGVETTVQVVASEETTETTVEKVTTEEDQK